MLNWLGEKYAQNMYLCGCQTNALYMLKDLHVKYAQNMFLTEYQQMIFICSTCCVKNMLFICTLKCFIYAHNVHLM